MVTRTGKGDYSKTAEAIAIRIGALEDNIASMTTRMKRMESGVGGNLGAPQVNLPYKIDEDIDGDGIVPIVSVNLPPDTRSLITLMIRKIDNEVKQGETTQQAIDRASQRIVRWENEMTETQTMNKRFIGRLEGRKPLRPKENADKNKYQLLRLIAIDDQGRKGKNPMDSPFDVFPFQALQVRSDGGSDENNRFFIIGDAISAGPSPPAANLIVANKVDPTTSQADGIITFKVFFSNADNTKTAEDLDIDECFVKVKPFSDSDANTSNDDKYTFGGPIIDKTKTFALIDVVQPLGTHLKWTANLTKNSAGKKVARPAAVVDIYAGGAAGTAGIPELETFTIAATPRNATHTLLTATIKQFANDMSHPYAVLLKRLIFTVQEETNGPVEREKKISLVDEENVFVQGATTTFQRKVQHRQGLSNITFGALLFAINSTDALPITRTATPATGGSILTARPTDPSALNFATGADDMTAENDAFADFTVGTLNAGGTPVTFRSQNIDTILIKLRRKKGDDGSPDDAGDDPDDSRLPTYMFPVEDPDAMTQICRVRDLAYGKRYRWRKNALLSMGQISFSTGAALNFRAGLALADPMDIALVSFQLTEIDEKHSRIIVTLRQTSPAVALKNIEIHQKLPSETTFDEIQQKALQSKPEAQVANGTFSVRFKVPHPKRTSGIQYNVVVRAVGNLTKTFGPFSQSTGDGKPAFSGQLVPAVPMAADIITNQIQAGSDPAMPGAEVVVRVFASNARAASAGGSGAGGVITFGDTNTSSITIIISVQTDVSEAKKIPFSIDIPDLTQHFVDVSLPGLAFGDNYAIRRYIASNGSGNSTQQGTVWFRAGGSIDLTNVLVAIESITNVTGDSRLTVATVRVSQPQAPNPARTVFLKNLQIERAQAPNITTFRRLDDSRVVLRDDADLFMDRATKTFDINVKHKKNTQISIRPIVKGVRGATGGNNGADEVLGATVTFTSGDEDSFTDTDKPRYVGGRQPDLVFRWKNVNSNGSSGMKFRLRKPNANMKTFESIFAEFTFTTVPSANGVFTYDWNPLTGEFSSSPGVFLEPPFYLELGDQFLGFIPAEKPASTINNCPGNPSLADPGDIPLTIANNLAFAACNGGIATLVVNFYIKNGNLTALGNTLNVFSQTLSFPFNGAVFTGGFS